MTCFNLIVHVIEKTPTVDSKKYFLFLCYHSFSCGRQISRKNFLLSEYKYGGEFDSTLRT